MQISTSVILITGASSGIGLSLTRQLLEKGGIVYAFSRRGMPDELKAEFPDRLLEFKGDVTSHQDMHNCVSMIEQRQGALHFVIANAGIAHFEDLADTQPDLAASMINTNVIGVYHTIHCSYALLKKTNGPRCVIGIHSIAATTIFEGASLYSATKAGTLAMFRSFREEARKDGISVLDVLPGATHTGIWTKDMLDERGNDMMQSDSIANIIISSLEQGRTTTDSITHIDELVIRPWKGNL